MHNKATKIKVAVRLRPFNKREKNLGARRIVEIQKKQILLYQYNISKNDVIKDSSKSYTFDECFNSFEFTQNDQEEIFKEIGSSVLDTAFCGYNACIFAYGQTGSGKSYTMMGTSEEKGIIPRLCEDLFERINKSYANLDTINFKVEVSYFEIYNEKVLDLLHPNSKKKTLKVREHNIYGPYVDGLSVLAVTSCEDVLSLMNEGNKSRTVASTNMNFESSRSHAIFTIRLTQVLTNNTSGSTGEIVSKMSLVDLAGSERVSKSGAAGARLKEGNNINKSLSTLGLVISTLAEQSQGKTKQKFIPYRDSVLTWILKDNLGGNSVTYMIATISPASDNYEEILSTLRYADRAKKIINHAVVNEDPNAKLIRELQEEIKLLKSQIQLEKSSVIKERLAESQMLMEKIEMPWEEKLLQSEKVQQERHQALENMGLVIESSGIKVQIDKYYLVNLNADPSLNELLVYNLKEEKTLIGRPETIPPQDIQLSGLGIMPEHAIIKINATSHKVTLIPINGARTCVNGSVIYTETSLKNGDRILWGNNHFFRINCPKNGECSSLQHGSHLRTPSSALLDYELAREELMMNNFNTSIAKASTENGTSSSIVDITEVIETIHNQHIEERNEALCAQKEMYEEHLNRLKQSAISSVISSSPSTTSNSNFTTPCQSFDSWHEFHRLFQIPKFSKYKNASLKPKLLRLKESLIHANSLVTEANFLAKELGTDVEFEVTLQIPISNLTPNNKKIEIISEPAVLIKSKVYGEIVWSLEKLENKLIDVREMYQARDHPLKNDIISDPFNFSTNNQVFIGMANIFLDVLLLQTTLIYKVPIISHLGEIVGRLHVKFSGSFDDCELEEEYSASGLHANLSSSISDDTHSQRTLQDSNLDDIEYKSKVVNCKLVVEKATGLSQVYSDPIFCQYSVYKLEDSLVSFNGVCEESFNSSLNVHFNHTREFQLVFSNDLINFASEGAISIEVWGKKKVSRFETFKAKDSFLCQPDFKITSLNERWRDVKSKIELWVEIQELNDSGEYAAVEVTPSDDVLCGGIYQVRQGHQRRVKISIVPTTSSLSNGSLPISITDIKDISIGSVGVKSKIQRALDSYQEKGLKLLREKWSQELTKRHHYLQRQIQLISKKSDKKKNDLDREKSLLSEWMSLTEEKNAIYLPAPGSEIPGALLQNWSLYLGMEKHIPILFLNISKVDEIDFSLVSYPGKECTLFKENEDDMFSLPLVNTNIDNTSCTASWDSSIHESTALNRCSSPNERIYVIIKVLLQLSHPLTMQVILRKRICINVYKKQSFAEKLRKRISGKNDTLYATGVTYEIVSMIPFASSDFEDRKTLAYLAAQSSISHSLSTNVHSSSTCSCTYASENSEKNEEEFTHKCDENKENYLEKYSNCIAAVDTLLKFDRSKQKDETIDEEYSETCESDKNNCAASSHSNHNVSQSLCSSGYESQIFSNE